MLYVQSVSSITTPAGPEHYWLPPPAVADKYTRIDWIWHIVKPIALPESYLPPAAVGLFGKERLPFSNCCSALAEAGRFLLIIACRIVTYHSYSSSR